MREKEEDYKEKIRRHRQSKLRFFCVTAGIIVFVLLAFFLYHTLRVYNHYVTKEVIERTESSSSVTIQIGENMVSYSKDGASCVDTDGNKIWNQTYEMQKPIVGHTSQSIAISDYNGMIYTEKEIENAFEKALSITSADGIILCCGSLYMIGAMRTYILNR